MFRSKHEFFKEWLRSVGARLLNQAASLTIFLSQRDEALKNYRSTTLFSERRIKNACWNLIRQFPFKTEILISRKNSLKPALSNIPQGKNVPMFTSMLWSKTKPHKSVWYPFSLFWRPNHSRIPLNKLSILNSICAVFFTKTDNKFKICS